MNAGNEADAEDLFRIDVDTSGSQGRLVLAGQIGLDATAQLKGEAIGLACGSKDVALDWSQCRHVSAAGLQIMLALAAALSVGHRSLRVTGDNPDVRRFLELAGLSSHFPVAEMEGRI